MLMMVIVVMMVVEISLMIIVCSAIYRWRYQTNIQNSLSRPSFQPSDQATKNREGNVGVCGDGDAYGGCDCHYERNDEMMMKIVFKMLV